jgi:hypothetical protein
MGRNNEDARSGLDRADIPGFEGTMGMLDGLVSKYTPNMQKKKKREGEDPSKEDVRDAYFSGKVTTEEANDLTNSDSFSIKDHPHNTKSSKPSDFSLDHAARYAHKRAGLSD